MLLLLCAAAALGLFTAAAQADDGITTWDELQAALRAGGTVTLTESITASSGSSALTVPSGTTVTLDLNGCTIDRNMTWSSAEGYAIVNNGELTIMDSSADMSGVITGAFGSEQAGAIQNNNRLYFLSGNISGNLTYGYGAGVLNCEGAHFTMTGGVICDNEAGNYGGGVCNRGEFRLEGGRIDNNFCRISGGGVANYGTFVMLDGMIVNNRSNSNCGGVYLHAGTATISGGSITGSTARDLYLEDNQASPKLNMFGAPVIGNLFLEGNSLITVTGAFASSADITVTVTNEGCAGRFTSGYGANHGDIHPTGYFHGKNASMGITLIDGEAALAENIVNFVPYVARTWNGTNVVSETRTIDATAVPSDGNMTGGWYVLNSNVTKDGRIESITGDVNLILGDGCTLDVKGLYVPAGSTLTIYGQTEGTGKIYSHPSGGAAIGGYSGHDNGNIVIHGGTVQATGYNNCAGIGSNDGQTTGDITIYGGTVTATGGSNGAGIGGGRDSDGGHIIIYGGTVTATGKDSSAGIGGGDASGSRADVSTIEIRGGTVTATGNSKGSGIGGGEYGHATITISGGNITATGGSSGGAGIGSGADGTGSTITITGGAVSATASSGGYGIGNGKNTSGSTITLGYTAATRDGISVTASSFGGTVTIENTFGKYVGEFEYPNPIFMPGVVDDNSLLTGSKLEAYINPISYWGQLQNLINGAPSGATIRLAYNITADYVHDTALVVGSGKNITIDLNGRTLDRRLTGHDAAADGYAIKNEGTLTITDSSSAQTGKITGGNCTGSGGGIYNSGTLTLSGGSITGNASATWGGGVYLPDGTNAVLNLNGGSITNNTCVNNGGGVHVSGTATMTVSGNPVVSGNMKSGTVNNINLAADAVIMVSGALTEGADLGVSSSAGTAFITRGYGAHNGTDDPDGYFQADQEGYGILPDTGEVKLDAVQNHVSYVKCSWNGTAVITETAYADRVRPVPQDGGMTEGWYYLNSDVTKNGRIESITGDVNLILGDGCTLNVKGLYVPAGSTLTIYSQTNGTGKIVSTPSGGAGIGGYSGHDNGSIVIHGGTIEATGYNNCAGIGSNDDQTTGTITIYGGTITATGGSNGAGIGGGRDSDGGHIIIYGGTVTATGRDSSAGIGGGDASGTRADVSTIDIYGGTVTATGNSKGSGIGGGEYGHATITISGGNITATGGSSGGAGIGSGTDGTGSTITITGGTINASSASSDGFGIGDGKNKKGTSTVNLDWTDATKETISITASSFGGTVTVEQPFVMYSTGRLFRVGAVSDNSLLAGGALTAMTGKVSTWEQLRMALECGGSIVVTGDITASSNDRGLQVPAGVTAELDLQGHTLDASALNPPAGVEYPCCLSINGSLTLSDAVGGGRFKGGDNGFIDFIAAESGSSFTMNGGAIVGSGTLENVVYVYDYATFTMHGGAVTADMNGTVRRFGRVSVDDYATFIMNGGTIGGSGGQSDIYADGGCVRLNGGSLTGSNPAYGNVYVLSADQIKNGELFVSGSPLMSTGVYLDYDHTITVAGPLGEGVIIPVMTEAKPTSAEPVIITNGLAQGGENAVSHFTSASDIWCVVLNDDGEAELRKAPTEWDTLQLLIDGTENDGVLTLEKDYSVTNLDRHLDIAGGKTLTIDLNGHTIDGFALNDDYVMTISGNLTLRDSTGGGTVLGSNHQDVIKTLSDNAVLCLESGTIHGDNCYDVVYVYAGGSFIMTGGTVSGSGSSGHIDVLVECGTFTLTGGSIRADQKGSDTAVLTTKYTNFNLQGSPDIKGSFELGKPIQFTGPISHDLRIKVRRTGDLHNEWNDVFTSGLTGNGTVSNFISYYPKNYAVGLNEAGEAFLGTPVTVSFVPGYETNETMDPVEWAKNGWYPLPACGFSGSAGRIFVGWQVGEGAELKAAGDSIQVTADTTVTAVWAFPAFGTPDFMIPAGTETIEAGAFEGIAAAIVEIPANCASIGDYAFRDCGQLTMIRIPAGCGLGTGVFDGCAMVYVFGTPGSDAENYCQTHNNCVFVEEGQD